ncbi:TetR family transcriptional regulator C-terminal domain-containing protein [Dactylosporangium sp. NPDC048998]|uniref:TetR family transcriptional regulator C-terminal domain-containing protein n=1 Tax=Dactylosporangium sp. NPDC048998 TaxID=3363976 RepID=UPI00372189A9
MSQPPISNSFASRDELIASAFAAADVRAKKAVVSYARETFDGRRRVIAYALGCLAPDPEISQSWELWHQVWSIGRFSAELEGSVKERQQAWIALMADAVADGQADRSISASHDPERVGLLLVTMLDGLTPALRYRLVDLDSARSLLVEAIEGILGPTPSISALSS